MRLGPYYDKATLQAIAKAFAGKGEVVTIDETIIPNARANRRYTGYIIRSGTA